MPSSPAEEAVRKAPLSPSHPSQEGPSTPSAEGVSRPAPGPVSPRNVEKEFNEIPTRVAVSYKTEGQKEVVKKEVPTLQPVVEKKAVEEMPATPRRSRRETVQPTKKKKSGFKAFFISLLIFLGFDFSRWLLWLSVCSVIFTACGCFIETICDSANPRRS